MFLEGNEKEDKKSWQQDIAETFLSIGDPKSYIKGVTDLMALSTRLNATFLQGRGRIEEMQVAIADAIPGVTRLGGTIEQTVETIGDIAEASRRNVIANQETVSELFATTKLIGGTVEDLANSFLDIGIGVENIGEEMEKSISYVQSIGGNAKSVMKEVVQQTDKLNRYQFEGGVQGLTKMAAQASMLRFDMEDTFRLAEKVLDPEGAIEVAAAFQRLGVNAGTLVDPFQMMNQSITDPSGLQTSLANVAKSFVSFNKEAGRFTINPEGVLRLREMEKEAELSSGSLSKMGIAAAEMGERMKQVSTAGLKFKNEEDKQFLANITSMGEGGVFQVNLEDGTKVDIARLQQDQFDRLIAREKDRPKTIEDMQRAQMGMSEIVKNDVRALRDKIVYGVVSMGPIPGLSEDLRGVTTAASQAISMEGKYRVGTEDVRKTLNDLTKDLTDVFKGPGDFGEKLKKFESMAEGKLKNIDNNLVGMFDKFLDNFKYGLNQNRGNQRALSDLVSSFQDDFVKPLEAGLTEKKVGQSLIEGATPLSASQSAAASSPGFGSNPQVLKGNLDMTIKHTFPPEFEKLKQSEQLKIFDEYLKTQMRTADFKNYFFGLIDSRVPSTVKRQ
jgi:hypothetical protein